MQRNRIRNTASEPRFGDRDLSDLERDDGRDLGDIENIKIEVINLI